tara:strand:+ start:596 stop:955 length:360 start_codon:yes stop_codon:yes gene_type:complete
MLSFISIRFRRVLTAIKGMFLLIKTEASIQSHLFIFSFFIFLGFYIDLDVNDWIKQILVFGFIISIEALNTGIEKICDFINPDHNKKIGFIKDVSAGAVSFAVIASLIAIVLIYYPYLF